MDSPVKPDDFMKMLDEIKGVKGKYNMPKGLLLVPDKLEISVQRVSYDNFHLSYREFFNYLPNTVRDIAILQGINLLVQTGIPREWIKRIDNNGVGLELDGNSLMIVACILPELLIQKRFDDAEISSLFSVIHKMRSAFTDLSELEYEWNSEIERKFYRNLESVSRVIREHPSAKAEIEAIVKKYTQPSETSKSSDAEES